MTPSDQELEAKVDQFIDDIAVLRPYTRVTKEAKRKLLALIKSDREELERAYGGCHNCYGKGYATKQEFVTGGGKKWKTSSVKYCDCSRGRQLEDQLSKEHATNTCEKEDKQ